MSSRSTARSITLCLGDVFEIPGVSGKAAIGPGETEWRFQPDRPWKAAEHQLVINMALEDLAGNRIGRPFDVETLASPGRPYHVGHHLPPLPRSSALVPLAGVSFAGKDA